MPGVVGLYGKLPSAGDFVGRGFSPELLHALDGLLQSALAAALGEGVHAHSLFERTPAFVLSLRPGALCASGFIGGIVPSQDRVGRLFPLCVGLEIDASSQRLPLAWPSLGLAQTLCALALRAQAVGATADQLWGELPDADNWQALSSQGVPFASAEDETVPRLSSEDMAQCFLGPEAAMGVVDRALCSRLPWSVQGLGIVLDSTGKFERFFTVKSLADPTPLAAVFDGQWVRWGWVEHRPSAPVPAEASVASAGSLAEVAASLVASNSEGDETIPSFSRIDKAASPADDPLIVAATHAGAPGDAAAASG